MQNLDLESLYIQDIGLRSTLSIQSLPLVKVILYKILNIENGCRHKTLVLEYYLHTNDWT